MVRKLLRRKEKFKDIPNEVLLREKRSSNNRLRERNKDDCERKRYSRTHKENDKKIKKKIK